jgi:hypothetical protein
MPLHWRAEGNMGDELAQLFLKYDYAETKDLCKQFCLFRDQRG